MKRSTVFNLLKIAFAASLIWWVVWERAGGPAAIGEMLRHMDRAQWALAVGVVLTSNCLSMMRWHLLMRSVGLNSTPWLALRLGFVGVFFNNVVPGLTGGDVVKAVYVTRENTDQRSAAVVSVIVDRVIGIVALALIAAVVIPFDFERYGEAALGIYGFLAAAGLGAVVTLSRRTKALIRQLLERIGFSSQTAGAGFLVQIEQAVSMYRHQIPSVMFALVLSVGIHLFIILGISMFAGALADGGLATVAGLPADLAAERTAQLKTFGQLGFDVYCSVIPIIMIISALPLAPAGWGVGEVAFVHFFAQVGVASVDSTALSLTYRLSATLISLLGGIFLFIDRRRVMEATHADSEPAD